MELKYCPVRKKILEFDKSMMHFFISRVANKRREIENY